MRERTTDGAGDSDMVTDRGNGNVGRRSWRWRVGRALRRRGPCLVALVLLAIPDAFAQTDIDQIWATKFEGVLPEYCRYAQSMPDGSVGDYGDPRVQKFFYPTYGPTFLHMHHYCNALYAMYNASLEGDKTRRDAQYNRALSEIEYVMDRAAPGFPLRWELYLNRGFAHMGQGDLVAAVEAFGQSIRERSDIVGAYLGLAECFERLGSPERARAILRHGIAEVPDPEPLRARLDGLDGD